MASKPQYPASPPCSVCSRTVWSQLQPEDVLATPHHRSRKALEQSAKTCNLCAMVLRAATSNYRDCRSIRNGRGYWRLRDTVRLEPSALKASGLEASAAQDISYVWAFGASMPMGNTSYSSGRLPALEWTGAIDSNFDYVEIAEDVPNVGGLNLDEPPDDMPVWLYGNYYANSPPKAMGDMSHLNLMGIGARFGRSASIYDAYNIKDGKAHLRGSTIRICTTDGKLELCHAFEHIPGRLREMCSDSDIAVGRVEKWIQQCTSGHSKCRAPDLNPELPTRVIDVLASDRGVALFESNGQRGRYTALSHCWGTSSRLMATKKSMNDLKDGIALSFLPETFQDAIKITRRLGIKYLWIDCFCIIQDDRQDWEREAARMAQIYRHSYVTIAAAGSTDSYSGCFPKRKDGSYVTPGTRSLGYGFTREAIGPKCQVVEYQHDSQPWMRNRIHLFDEWMPGSSYFIPQLMDIGSFGKTFDPIADQPLSTRGWTLQERLLPARVIHYANDQMYFECEDSILSEDGFVFKDLFYSMSKLLHTQRCPFEVHGLRKNSGLSFVIGQVPGEKSPGVRSQGGWLFLVENFTRRKLTYAQDKLSAIAGVARVLAEETNDLYWAGLWALHIYEDLCWRVCTHEEYFDKDEHGRNNKPFSLLSYANLVAKVSDCSVTPAGNDQFGRVSGAKLDILAPIYEIAAYEPKKPWDQHGIPAKIDLGDERGVCAGVVHLDIPDEPLQFPCYALFLDPGKALIIKGKELEPYRDANGKDDPNRLVPKGILSTGDVNRNYREPPKGESTVWVKGDENSTDPERRKPRQVTISEKKNREVWEYWKDRRKTIVHKSTNDAVRIGMGEFVRTRIEDLEREKQEPVEYDTAVKGKLKLEDVLYVAGDGSWGPVANDDQKVLVTVL